MPVDVEVGLGPVVESDGDALGRAAVRHGVAVVQTT